MDPAVPASATPTSVSFNSADYFPPRRRIIQACVNCRTRKTRCDAAQPRCSLCAMKNLPCEYKDAQQPRVDHNTKILLERIQILENRMLSLPAFNSSSAERGQTSPVFPPPSNVKTPTGGFDGSIHASEPVNDGGMADPDVQIPLSHTANANHVYSWPIVRELLGDDGRAGDATDIFFEPCFPNALAPGSLPLGSWHIFEQGMELDSSSDDQAKYRDLIHVFFSEVATFFPLLSREDITHIFENVFVSECGSGNRGEELAPSRYALLIIVLCLGAFVADRQSSFIHLDDAPRTRPADSWNQVNGANLKDSHENLWKKAKLLLGFVSSELSMEAAQCALLVSIYLGACGKVSDSFYWTHTTAIKCEGLARILTRQNATIPDSFRRLYWLTFIYEGDFVSEISIALLSGLARYEDLIPYPEFSKGQMSSSPRSDTETFNPASGSHDEVIAFQVTTNSAIRRFLNRVNSVVYDNKEKYRAARANYATWLLRVSEDLWSHHAAIYQNLPDFLLTSLPRETGFFTTGSSPTAVPGQPVLGNNPWNVARLKGRYCAGQYIIHRPFIQYVLLNVNRIETHPCKAEMLEKSRRCLDGCRGFIRVFDVDPANSITNLFAAGMVTFTMTMILMIATVSPPFREILPDDVEEAIYLGARNLRRFSLSVEGFQWHISILQRLDTARKARLQTQEVNIIS